MKLKYYMRGLGIGIVVTALLMGFAIPRQKEPMTDEEIRQRALEMGMTLQDGVLADDLGKTDEEPADESITISENEMEELAEPHETESAESMESDETVDDEGQAESEAEVDNASETARDEIIVITVNTGDGSRTVANKLQEAGLVEDAAAYDAYLCQNGYDKRIATGNHEIPVGASLEEIAKEVTTRKNQ